MKKPLILVVEDNTDMRETIFSGLGREGYDTIGAGSAKELFEKLRTNKPDAILLDIGLPDQDGLSLMAQIRGHTDAPVIVVSGKNDTVDKIVGIEMGADDYVGKPFQMKELSVRIKAQLRRSNGQIVPGLRVANTKKAEKLKFREWLFDRARLQVFDTNGNSAGLTVKEFKLLEAFVTAPHRVLSREQLLDLSRSEGFNVTDRAIDTQIVRLRKKLGSESDDLIQSVRGAGYMFTADVSVTE